MDDESVTMWLRQISEGNQDAARLLWNRYAAALQRLAKTRYRGALSAVANEEDLVQSVFRALWTGAAAGQWDSVQDRNELWWLLLTITRRTALKRQAYNARRKRGGPTASLSAADTSSSTSAESPREPTGDNPPPELILMLQEEQDRLLAMLRDDVLRSIAIWKLEGYTHEEIAAKLNVTTRTVIRKLNLIRETWSTELSS